MIIKLQTIVGYQEEEIANLSKELYTQQKEIRELRDQVAGILSRLRALSEASAGPQDKAPEPPPPHY